MFIIIQVCVRDQSHSPSSVAFAATARRSANKSASISCGSSFDFVMIEMKIYDDDERKLLNEMIEVCRLAPSGKRSGIHASLEHRQQAQKERSENISEMVIQ